MQLLSLAACGWPAPALAFFSGSRTFGAAAEFIHHLPGGWWILVVEFAVLNVVNVFAHWLASKPVAAEEGDVGHAVLLQIYLLLVGFAVLVAFGLVAFGVQKFVLASNPVLFGKVMLGLGSAVFLIMCISLVLLAGRVYQIDSGRAFAFLVLSLILNSSMLAGLEYACQEPVRRTALALGQRWQMRQNAPKDVPPALDTAGAEERAQNKSKPMAERQKALQEYYDILEKERSSLRAEDTAAVANYEARRARYEQILAEMRAEVAAQAPAPAPAP